MGIRIMLALTVVVLSATPSFPQETLQEDRGLTLSKARTTDQAGPATPRNAFGARSKSECPKESHPKAIDPWKVECFAEFALKPIPRAPDSFDPTPAEIAALNEHGYELVRQLNQPGVCGKDAKVPRFMTCAVIVYTIDRELRQTGVSRSEASYVGPWAFVMKVYRISHPEDIESTTIWTVNSNFSDGWYASESKNALWKLTAVQRQAERCRETRALRITDNTKMSVLADECRDESAKPSFTPMLIIPYAQASEFFANDEAVKFHFSAPPYYVENPELAKRQ